MPLWAAVVGTLVLAFGAGMLAMLAGPIEAALADMPRASHSSLCVAPGRATRNSAMLRVVFDCKVSPD